MKWTGNGALRKEAKMEERRKRDRKWIINGINKKKDGGRDKK